MQVQGLTALDAAIKWGHYLTVVELLKAGASVVRSFNIEGGIKINAPALYLACRQFDVRILKAILLHEVGEWISIEDYKEAAIVALKVENIDGLRLLIDYVKKGSKDKLFLEQYKFELLKEAVCLGSIPLFKSGNGFEN